MLIARVSTSTMIFGRVAPLWGTFHVPTRRPCPNPASRVQTVRQMSSVMKPRDETEAEAKILTSRIKQASSPKQFFAILEKALDREIFNDFHASVAYHSLATWKRIGKLQASDKNNPILANLNRRFQVMLDKGQVSARPLANVLWSVAHLSDVLPNFLDILPALAGHLPEIAKDMNAQEVSNCLWAAATLKEAAPDALKMVPMLANQVHVIAKDMIAQHVSNCLWAAATLKEAAPDAVKMLSTLAALVPMIAKDMNAQGVSNCLWAAATLKEAAPDAVKMVSTLAAQVPRIAKDMIAQHVSNSLWAAATLKEAARDALKIVPALANQLPGTLKAALVLLRGSVPEVDALLSAIEAAFCPEPEKPSGGISS